MTAGPPGRGSRGVLAGVAVALAFGLGGATIAHFAWTGDSSSPTSRGSIFAPTTPPRFSQPSQRQTGSGGSASSGGGSVSAAAARVDPGLVDINTTTSSGGAAAGTGMVVTSSGEVITNNHVIEGATSISATDIGNGKTYTARVVGYDKTHDVAVIQLVGASNLTTVPLGDSSTVHAGQTVVTLGNAGGTGGTPSAASGKVSALGQSITTSDELDSSSEHLSGLIQFNGSLQPGDSGGPLVNSSNQVIGMDTAASSNLGFQTSSGQDYAIPINDVLSIARNIVAGKSSSTIHIGATALIGVEISPNAPYSYAGGTPTQGAYVAGVVPGSSAANAGIAAGDTITGFNGQTITSPTALTQAKDGLDPGAHVSVTWVDSSGNSHTATITLTSGPAD
jgi:S1-C subfamily serine protease